MKSVGVQTSLVLNGFTVKKNIFKAESEESRCVSLLIKEKLEQIAFYESILGDLEFRSNEYDLVYSNISYEKDNVKTLKRRLRFLRILRLQTNRDLKQACIDGLISTLYHHGAQAYPIFRRESRYVDSVVKVLYNKYLRYEDIKKFSHDALLSKYKNPWMALDIEECDFASEYEDEDLSDLQETLGKIRNKCKETIRDEFDIHFAPYEPRQEEFELVRNVGLQRRIRSIIRAYEDMRNRTMGFLRRRYHSVWHYLNSGVDFDESGCIPMEECSMTEYHAMPEDPSRSVYDPVFGAPGTIEFGVEPQMERESKDGDCEVIKIDKKENVILTSHAEESLAKPVTIPTDNWEKLCSSQDYQSYDIMQRWKKHTVVKWSKDYPRNTSLINEVLPKSFVKAHLDSPNCLLFKTYSYCKFDMEIKIQINSNRFHIGQLQASFYYGSSSDQHYSDKLHIAAASQMTHCILDASSASDGVLYIPFRYYKPLLATRVVDDDSNILDLGSFRLLVLNPLTVPNGDTSNVDVSVFIRFVNPRFHGMIDRGIGSFDSVVEPQMMLNPQSMKQMVKGAENLLNTIFPDEQRDNPTDPLPPMVMQPQNAQSWCVGDMLSERTNVLRMQGNGVTPHPPGTLPKESEMDIDYIKSVYGLCSTHAWSTSDPAGSILFKIPFSPILGEGDYFKTTIDNGASRSCEIMPPVSVLANLFAYWRGSLDYRIDFVSSQFHTGRLLVAYVPRVIVERNPTLEQLTCCDHIILDIRTNKQYQFINRFLSDKPWWPRRKADVASTESHPPGYIYFAVLNRLTATPTVAPKIEFNLYMRGADDFELHVPVAPHIGLSFNTQIIERDSFAESYVSTYGPPQEDIYVGTWHTLSNKTGFSVAMFRYGPGADHVTQFNPPTTKKVNLVYEIVGRPDDIKFYNKQKVLVNAQYMVLVPPIYELNSTKYWYGLAFNSINVAKAYARTIKADPSHPGFYTVDYKKMSESGDEADYSQRKDVIYWEAIESLIEPQMEEERKDACGSQVSIHPPLTSTGNGMYTFGEKITSLKQLVRRYQPYCAVRLPNSNSDALFADAKIPVLPQGLDLALESNYDNQNRDGLIPICLSGYRFFRGGVRMRLLVSDSANSSRHIWVQHKCDERLNKLGPSVNLDKKNSNNRYTSGYASYMQNLQTNSVVSVEIPFYLPGQFGLLQRPNLSKPQDSTHYGLGNLYVGIDYGGKTAATSDLYVYYSLSDDFHASVFQGFPPVFRLTEFQNKVYVETTKDDFNFVEGQMDVEGNDNGSWFSLAGIKKKMQNSVVNLAVDAIEDRGGELAAKFTEKAQITEILDNITDSMDESKKVVVMAGISNVLHAIINPSYATLAWSMAAFLMTLGILSYNMLSKVFGYFKSMLNRIFPSANPQSETDNSGRVEPQAPGEFDDAAFVSTCVAGALALMKTKATPLPNNIPDFAKYMYEGLPKFTLSANGLFTFFKNNLNMLKRIFHWVVSFVRPESCLYSEIDEGDLDILAYVKKLQWCLDAQNERKVQTDMNAQLQVYLCANIAQILLAKMSVSKVEKSMPVFTRYLYKIVALRDKLAREFVSPPVRYEPFTLGLVGPSNIGKSHLASRLSSELIASIGYKTYEELIYVRTPGNPYWNNLHNQPVCLYDDFLCLQDQQFGLMQVAELFCLKSNAVFNPTKAVLEEKNIRYNPLIVLLCTNVAFPVINGVSVDEALWRRRDVLVHAQMKRPYIGMNPRNIPNEVTKEYGHLEFRVYANPVKQGFLRENGKDKVFSFGEINAYIIKQHHNYHDKECRQYQERLSLLQKHFPELIDVKDTIEDNLERLEAWAKSKFGDAVDIDKIRMSTMMGGPDAPIQNKINKEKLKYVQNSEEAVYGANIESVIFAEKGFVQRLGGGETVEGQMNEEEPECAVPEICSCIESDLKMINNLNDGRVMVIAMDGMFELGNCTPECVFQRKSVSKNQRKVFALHIRDRYLSDRRPLDLLPLNIREIIGVNKTAVQVMSEVDHEIEENVAWYRRWLKSMPSFWGVVKFLGKFTLIVAALWGAIATVSCLFNSTKHAKADHNNAVACVELSEASAHDATKVNETIHKLWKENTIDMENSVRKMFNCDTVDQMPASGTSATVGVKKGNPAVVKSFAMGQSETELHEVVFGKIKRNTFWLKVEYMDENDILRSTNMRCLGIGGRYALILDHYYHYIRRKCAENGSLWYLTSTAVFKLNMDDLVINAMNNSALYLVQLPLAIPCFANIMKFFANSVHHSNLAPSATLVEPVYNPNKGIVDLNLYKFPRITKQEKLVIENDDKSKSIVDTVYVYPKSMRGLCGSVLVSAGNINRPIIGIHVAGIRDGISGYSEALSFESFSWIADKVVGANVGAIAQMPLENAKMLPDTNVSYIGIVPPDLECKPPNKSRLIPTECAGLITEVRMDIPVLSEKDERIKDAPFSPLFEGIRNHGLVPLDFPKREVYNAFVDLRDQILTNVIPQRVQVGVLTVEQSIVGIEDKEFYDPLDMKTSEGFPFCKLRPKSATNKSWLFDIDYAGYPKVTRVDPFLLEVMKTKDEMREKGEIPVTIFVACLKDAKLPKEKVLVPGKTRVFSISPIDFTIQQRQYFMDFAIAYQEARFDAEHAIGIDIKSEETTELVDKLLRKSKFLLTGDYAKFGDQLMASCVFYVYSIICEWYIYNGDASTNNARKRMIFCEEVMHSYILAINTIYQNFCGMPSGNSLTVIINSMVNSMYVRVVWQLIMKNIRPDLYPLSQFHINTARVFYGDDLFMAVTEEVLQLFNVQTMSDKFAEFGIKFTDSSKSQQMKKYCEIFEPDATFLKHSFWPHPERFGQWLAKLDDVAAEEICNWTWDTIKDVRESSVVACTSMLEEMYGHGEEYYDKMRERVIKFWRERGVDVKIPLWYEMDFRIHGW